ncbi:MAG: cation-transporting P-type ATPase [Candidatus Moranbacteria bacterium]|nr:cation-transporting P-type ATPase [Candidatus Moranbacteria bacterium]MBP6034084.1 cation-transporting P-type ATPase [Candidatus Moranbacteria bacterium]MBP7695836.1 cation-transporting P-type ATPase [Candidatus Moranbacteria bacterium]
MAQKPFYQYAPEEAVKELRSSMSGLSQAEADERIKISGLNRIEQKHKFVALKLFVKQFNDVFVWILATAGIFAFALGEMRDAGIVAVIVLVNATIGFIQEYKAEQIIEKLARFVSDTTVVFRDGEKKEIPATDIVPGDIVYLDAGSSVPADGYVIEAYNFKVQSFIFTGESVPEKRQPGAMTGTVARNDIENLVYMGESVVLGEAKVLVLSTGAGTDLGQMAEMTHAIKQEPTPLQKKMEHFARSIALLSIAIGSIVVVIARYQDFSFYESFLIGLALAVSVVPEGLPAAMSVAFALGMKRLFKHHVLAKRLSSVETLGSVSIICTDKTGTITKNELSVTDIVLGTETFAVSGSGYEPKGDFSRDGVTINPAEIPGAEMLFRIGTLANDASLSRKDGRPIIIGDPTEGAIIVAARKYNPRPDFFEIGFHKVAEQPFTSERRRMSVLYENAETRSYVKGSPDSLLELATEWIDGGVRKPFAPADKDRIRKICDDMSSQALRVLAFAYRDLDAVPREQRQEEMERDLVWVGMMAMIDPPREGLREAIDRCRTLGVKVVMVTGDYEKTARAIAEKIGLCQAGETVRVINGASFPVLSDREILSAARAGAIFARIAPDQKFRLASVLQVAGEVVAMTGDGVNDALALKKADIGIAMGITGTDVSKDAADMILLDDHFSSIVRAVREGRTIFENLRKSVHYVFTSNASELFTVLLGFLFGIPSPITAVQILSIDLATDVFPSFALGVEPEEPDARQDASTAGRRVMDMRGVVRILMLGALMALGAVATFVFVLYRGGWEWGSALDLESALYRHATTAAYLTLALTQMANLLQSRSETRSFFRMPFFSNPWIFVGMGISVLILFMFTNLPFFHALLGMAPVDGIDWLVALGCTLIVFCFEELRKLHTAHQVIKEKRQSK